MSILFVPQPAVGENGRLLATGNPLTGTAQHNLALATVGGVMLTVPAGAVSAQIQAKTATVSMTLDGSAASATVGEVLAVGVTLTLTAVEAAYAKFFSATGTLDVEYLS